MFSTLFEQRCFFLSFFQTDRKWWTRKGQGLKSTDCAMIFLYKSLFFSHFPAYMKSMFSLQSSSYDLLSKPKVMTYGLKSFSYFQLNSGMQCQTFFALVFRHNFLIRLLCEDFYFMYFCVVSARIHYSLLQNSHENI